MVKDSFALRCNGKIVSEGDSKSEVITKCGEPNFKDNLQKEYIKIYAASNIQKKTYTEIEYWLYDFGSHTLVRLLEFEDNRLIKITTGDYGGQESDPENCQEPWVRLPIGYLKPQIIMQCGKPNKMEHKEEHTIRIKSDNKYELFQTIKIDEWTFDFGSRYPLSVLRFENGVLTHVFSKEHEN
jgi:hypothetical protein